MAFSALVALVTGAVLGVASWAVVAAALQAVWIAACLSARYLCSSSLVVSGMDCRHDAARCQRADAAGKPASSQSFSFRWQLRHQSLECFASSVSACEMVSLQREVCCASSQRLEALGACLWSMSVHCVSIFRGCQRCIRPQYVFLVRNTHITGRNYDPTLVPFPRWVFSQGQGGHAPSPLLGTWRRHRKAPLCGAWVR